MIWPGYWVRCPWECQASHPSIYVLSLAGGGSVGIALAERVRHAHAFDRLLLDPIDRLGRADAARFEDRRHDIDHVMELRADAASVLDATGPGDAHALARSAEVR